MLSNLIPTWSMVVSSKSHEGTTMCSVMFLCLGFSEILWRCAICETDAIQKVLTILDVLLTWRDHSEEVLHLAATTMPSPTTTMPCRFQPARHGGGHSVVVEDLTTGRRPPPGDGKPRGCSIVPVSPKTIHKPGRSRPTPKMTGDVRSFGICLFPLAWSVIM